MPPAPSPSAPLALPFGTWPSPLTAEHLNEAALGFDELRGGTTPGSFLVAEAHPAAGRTELVEWRPTTAPAASATTSTATTAILGSSATYSRHSLLPAPYSVGTDVHSYGGGSFAPLSATRVVLSDERVHGVWALQLLPQSAAATGQQPATDTTTTTTTTTTPSLIEIVGGDDNVSFADFAPFPSSSSSPDFVVCVREDRRGHPPGHADNTLVLIDLTRRGDDAVTPLLAPGTTAAAAADFYSHPRFSPDGAHLSWLQWAHPDMPWTGAQLMVAPFDRVSGRLAAAPRHVAGAANKESCVQPSWSPVVAPAAAAAPGCDHHHQPQRSRLWFVCDRSRFWQLYTYDPVSALPPEPVVLPGLELGEFASPAWTLAPQTLAFLTPTTLVAAWTANATEQLVLISAPADGRPPSWSPLGLPLTNIRNAALATTSPTSFAVVAATVRSPPAVFAFDVATRRLTVVASSAPEVLGKESVSRAVHLSVPRTTAAAVTIPTSGHDAPDPDVDNHTHLFFFPPRNARFVGIPGTLPPLIVRIHDGPTSHAGPALSLHNQYLTSRGFAVAVVNPAGSSGYGRAYRDMLDGLWGVLDIADVLECASYLAKKGYVDGTRVGVTGESSGGYVTLCVVAAAAAAAKQSSSYAARISAAVSTAGISDLALLATQTHKFESRYLDRLLFTPNAIPTDPAVRTAVYHARSPRVTLASNSGPAPPLLLLQGTADVIVPPEQASALAKDMAAVGRWVHLVTFDGEGHGWPRRADHRRRALAEADEWWGEYLVGPARRANDEKEKGTGGGLIESFLGPLRSVVRPEDAAAGKVPVRAFVALSVVGAFPMVVRWVGWWLGDGPRSK